MKKFYLSEIVWTFVNTKRYTLPVLVSLGSRPHGRSDDRPVAIDSLSTHLKRKLLLRTQTDPLHTSPKQLRGRNRNTDK